MSVGGRLRRIHAHIPLAVLALLLARPTLVTSGVGTVLVAAGMMVRVWAAGVLEKGQRLCTGGPYRYVRHPLYLGTLLAAVGFCVMMNGVWGWVVVFPLFLVLYSVQVVAEERHLTQRYGGEHQAYAERVPMLIPRPGRRAQQAGSGWRLSQMWANREHYHLLLTLLLVVLFYARALWGW